METMYAIPEEILQRVFVDGSRFYRASAQYSIEEQIETLVVRPRVLVDCNLVGGTQALVDLSDLKQERPLNYTTVIHIPKERTQGRSINSVLNVSFFNSAAIAGYAGAGIVGMGSMGGGTGYNGTDNSAMMAAAAGVMSAFDKIPMTSTARVSLIAENTIMVRDGINLPNSSYLRCILANDSTMSGLPLRAYHHFSTLVELATKAYIYRELVVKIDTGELRYGQNVGVFKDIVTGYADSNQNYKDYVKDVWTAVALMSDEETWLRHIKLAVGGNR